MNGYADRLNGYPSKSESKTQAAGIAKQVSMIISSMEAPYFRGSNPNAKRDRKWSQLGNMKHRGDDRGRFPGKTGTACAVPDEYEVRV
jgi:hypothetical protein